MFVANHVDFDHVQVAPSRHVRESEQRHRVFPPEDDGWRVVNPET